LLNSVRTDYKSDSPLIFIGYTGIEESAIPEVLDIFDDLLKHNIIEKN